MFTIINGKIIHPRIKQKIYPKLAKGHMPKINGIIVHQTDTKNAKQTFNSFAQGHSGTHFLIKKDGTIYQTASIYVKLQHVGPLKLRCHVEKTCTSEHRIGYKKSKGYISKSLYEQKNYNVPNRYPSNKDSLGVELVGKAYGKKNHEVYEKVTKNQNDSLKWLIENLRKTLAIPATEIFKHPDVSRKNPTEASTAKWN